MSEETKFGAYHKIQSIYKRDMSKPDKPFLMDQFSIPEFKYLQHNEWEFTEKVDGTNIRVLWQHETQDFVFGGRTNKAKIPAKLMTELFSMFDKELFIKTFPKTDAILYGEGYGGKIQKGFKYSEKETFVTFDVRIGPWWLQRENVEEISQKVGLSFVPLIGNGTLHDAIEIIKSGLTSNWGNFEAEGIIAKPKIELKSRNGGRIITKIKSCDFK